MSHNPAQCTEDIAHLTGVATELGEIAKHVVRYNMLKDKKQLKKITPLTFPSVLIHLCTFKSTIPRKDLICPETQI